MGTFCAAPTLNADRTVKSPREVSPRRGVRGSGDGRGGVDDGRSVREVAIRVLSWTGVARAVAAALALALAVIVALVVGPLDWPSRLVSGPEPTAGNSADPSASTPTASPAPAAESTPAAAVLEAVEQLAADGAPTTAGLTAAVAPLLGDPALGTALGLAVATADGPATAGPTDTTGLLIDIGADEPLMPASTLKVLTAVAALHSLGPDTRFTTTVEQPSPGRIVLVGGGDPSLSQLLIGSAGAAPYPITSLEVVARRTVEALRERGITTVSLGYRADLFTGPAVNPAWEPGYVPNDQVAPVSALALDGGRERPGFARRAADPAAHAAQRFAALLDLFGVTVTSPPTPATEPPAEELVSVPSPTVANLVTQMLVYSDNDAAEVLGRHVARAEGEPASFAGATVAIRAALDRLELPTTELVVQDASGLARGNRVTAAMLVAALSLAFEDEHRQLRPLLGALPIAGFTGTLDERFGDELSGTQVGDVRAKTGYLTGAVTLAGYVLDEEERPLVFAVLANGMTREQALDAQQAVDRIAAAIAACGCD